MALTLIVTTLALLQLANTQQDVPTCLQSCLTEVGTTLCDSHAIAGMTPCLAKACPNPPATQNLIASLDVAFTPKAEYSCQQAYGPGDAGVESTSVTLPLNGTCANSPYGFKSFLPSGVSRIRANIGCRVMIFSGEDCLGEEASSDVGTLSNGQCVFRGGRSARLTCRNELDAARAYIQSTCDNGDDESENDGSDESEDTETSSGASSSSSSTVYPSSAPFHGPLTTSSSTSSSIPFHWPFSTSTTSGTASENTADAAGASQSTSSIPSSLGNATATVPTGNSTITSAPADPPQNGTQTSYPAQDANNVTHTLTVPTVPAGSATTLLPSYTGVAARLGAETGVALGLVGAVFAFFL